MSSSSQPASLFSQVDIGAASPQSNHPASNTAQLEQTILLRQVLQAQDRQNELLEEMVNLLGAANKQRAGELIQWKKSNPELSRACRRAAEQLSKVQVAFLDSVTEEVEDNAEHMMEGEFMLNEFVDRFGPRLAHLNGVLQVLSQLASPAQNNGDESS